MVQVGSGIFRIVEEFHDIALIKAENPDSLLNDDVACLVTTLQEFSREEGLSPAVVFSAAATLARPTFCAGWLFNRAFTKPRGYPGDYLLIQRIYDGPVSGCGLAALLDRGFLASPLAQAVQNRRVLLDNLLWEYAAASDGRPIRILSLGSGPGQELIDFVTRYRQTANCSALSITCIDVDLDALTYLRDRFSFEPALSLTTIHQDIRLLAADNLPQVDFAYAAGVFDYFSDPRVVAVLNVVWDGLSEGGMCVLGNFANRRPVGDQFAMDYVTRWHLRYRDEQELQHLVSRSRFGTTKRILAEPNNINLFALLQK